MILTLCFVGLMATACSSGSSTTETTVETASAKSTSVSTNLSKLDMTKWQYNADDDVYYQIGIVYCENPANEEYEQLAVFVPGANMTATDNGDGTYTCELNTSAEVNGYTSSTAPVVMPINTPGYSAQSALTEYKSVNMYTPLYYLLQSEDGYGTSTVAKYWRIRTGINQGDTSLTTEVNLALALENYDGVESVDFETVWGQGHTQAERTGDSTTNFIEWVNTCMKG